MVANIEITKMTLDIIEIDVGGEIKIYVPSKDLDDIYKLLEFALMTKSFLGVMAPNHTARAASVAELTELVDKAQSTYLEAMAAAYLLSTDIDPREVVLIQEIGDLPTSIKFTFTRKSEVHLPRDG